MVTNCDGSQMVRNDYLGLTDIHKTYHGIPIGDEILITHILLNCSQQIRFKW